MTGILAEIVSTKRETLTETKRRVSLDDVRNHAADVPEPRGFTAALASRSCALIAEIKTASPSRGIIRADVNVEDVARLYTDNGASCISVLTEENYFGGSLERLRQTRSVTSVPLLRKDFIVDPYQIYEARAAEADAVLLIVSCCDGTQLTDLMGLATDLGMDALVEVHDEAEIARASATGAGLIGINNRDLKTFITDLAVTGHLAELCPSGALLVSESGIHTPDDVRAVHHMGAHAILVGESLMRADDMAASVHELATAVDDVSLSL